MKLIESASNPRLKLVARLARPRRREAKFLLEGKKLVATAIETGIALDFVVVSSDFEEAARRELPLEGVEVVAVRERLFQKLTSLERPEGVLAVAARPAAAFDQLPSEGHVLVSMGVQDPGNLGALARVAEAAGARALVVMKGSTDPFGPKALRGSMGSLLRLPAFELEDDRRLVERGFRTAALTPQGGVDFRDADLRPPLALLLGRESSGLAEDVSSRADVSVTIPMKGRVESLNVATAAALVLFEATRRGSESAIS